MSRQFEQLLREARQRLDDLKSFGHQEITIALIEKIDAALAPDETPKGICSLCHQSMPKGEEMFRFHGYSITCEEAAKAGETHG